MKKVLTIGGATQDTFIQYDAQQAVRLHTEESGRCSLLIEEGQKIEISDLIYHTGGGATNAAASFSKLGFDTTAFFKIGNDTPGSFILEELNKLNIKTQPVKTKTGQTGIAFVIPCPSGDRIIFVYRGVNMDLREDELPLDQMRETDLVYVTSLNGPASQLLLPIARYAKENEKMVAVNPGTTQLKDATGTLSDSLPYIDILIMNATEAQLCAASLFNMKENGQRTESPNDTPELLRGPISASKRCFELKSFFKEMLARGPRIVVVTNGADGVYVAHEDALYYHPSIQTDVISTLGAGDSFGSCFVGSLLRGASIEDAIRYGVINSSSVIQHIGGKVGLLDFESLKKKAVILDPELLVQLD